MPDSRTFDVLVIGAGPAGVGASLALLAVEGLRFGVLERGRVGQTFLDWPRAQRFLTPSFTGNGFGAIDLNSVHPDTSPAYSLGTDYPSGPQYAKYLRGVAGHFSLPILEETDVHRVEPCEAGFRLDTSRGRVTARHLIWAGGEFHTPATLDIAGVEHGVHSSEPKAWDARTGQLVVVGGFESGIDLACHHAQHGNHVVVVDPAAPWGEDGSSDASVRLAPRTRQRLAATKRNGRVTLLRDAVSSLAKFEDGRIAVATANGERLTSDSAPILAHGYGPGLGPVAELFDTRDDGWPLLTEDDESTTTPGLFLTGPAVRHGGMKFCFIYKFRQRFAHVARVIGERLELPHDDLEFWREQGMLVDDLSCCGTECAC